MPLYEYHCPDCGKDMEILRKISESHSTQCPECGGNHLEKLTSATAFQLKGGGWYKDGYGGGSCKPSSSGGGCSGGG